MQSHYLVRGFVAAASAALWLTFPSSGRAQDILKELEDTEHTQARPSHDHHNMEGAKKKEAPAAHQKHGGHRQTEKKGASSGHQDHGGQGHSTSHTATQSGSKRNAGKHEMNGVHGGMHEMRGFLGPYPIQREGSGTSWLPDATPHFGVHATYGDWQTMYHALFNLVYDNQGGPRGGNKTFVNGMFMGMAQRPLGEGTWGLRGMLAPDPFMGPNGYPLLLATGETADGRTHLIDRQHPHDLFMELATTYSYDLSKNSSVYIYAGLRANPRWVRQLSCIERVVWTFPKRRSRTTGSTARTSRLVC